MTGVNYTRAEAEALIGARFKTRVEWDGVSRGMTGRVLWASGAAVWAVTGPYENYEVILAWDLPPRDGKASVGALTSRFTKFQVQNYMRKVSE